MSSSAILNEQGRCGLGPRLPMIAISPCSKTNFVDHAVSDQSSVTKFIEGNWGLGNITGSFANEPYNQLAPTSSAYATVGPLADLFNFAGCAAPTVFINPFTGATTSTPEPLLPESPWAALLPASALLIGGALLVTRRRRAAA